MFYDQKGRPDPNGNCQMIDGKLVLRPGHSVRFDISMIDSMPTSSVFLTDSGTQISDAQLTTFRDSDEGRLAVAYAKSVHNLNSSCNGPWTDQMERQALADAMAVKPRDSLISDAAMADAKAKENAAYQRSVAALNRSRN
ncbi:hypothetical protein [Sphingobium sp. LF-16]|nr:hypothetical protein [Sphingobium sp. LF-16]